MKYPSHNEHYWDTLVERYFEAETSKAEEDELRHFLCSPQGSSHRYDEVRAVMGYLAKARSVTSKKIQPRPQSNHRWLRPISIAASITIALGLTFTTLWTSQTQTEVYLAYVDGNKITDRKAVMQLMQNSIAQMEVEETNALIEEQLGDMFSAIEE